MIAKKHIHTAVANVIREDYSTWHTFFFNMETGEPDHGSTCQGYRDGSAWARGQAWGVIENHGLFEIALTLPKSDETKR